MIKDNQETSFQEKRFIPCSQAFEIFKNNLMKIKENQEEAIS